MIKFETVNIGNMQKMKTIKKITPIEMEEAKYWQRAQSAALEKVWKNEPDGLWESYLTPAEKKKLGIKR